MNRVEPNRRRWYQYSLRTLLVLVTMFCVWLGARVERARQQHELIAAIKEFGGFVYYDFEFNADGNLVPRAEAPGPAWLRELIGIDYFAAIGSVNCGEMNDGLIDRLRGQTHLQHLTLTGEDHLNAKPKNHITDTALEYLSGLTTLRTLAISDSDDVTDVGLEHLHGLTNLKSLELTRTNVTHAGAVKLKTALPHCRIVYFHNGTSGWVEWSPGQFADHKRLAD